MTIKEWAALNVGDKIQRRYTRHVWTVVSIEPCSNMIVVYKDGCYSHTWRPRCWIMFKRY